MLDRAYSSFVNDNLILFKQLITHLTPKEVHQLLMQIIKKAAVPYAKLILEQHGYPPERSRSLLILAIRSGAPDLVKLLLIHGADSTQEFNSQPVHLLAYNSNEIFDLFPTSVHHGQSFIILLTASFGFKPDLAGVCLAVAYLGQNAVLTYQFHPFLDRIRYITKLVLKAYLLANAKPEDYASTLSKKKFKRIKNLISVELGDIKKRQPETYFDLFAFSYCTKVIQSSSDFSQLSITKLSAHSEISQAHLIMQIVQSKALEEMGGLVKIGFCYGVYTKSDMRFFIESLQKALLNHPNIDRVVSVIMRDIDHALNISFDPQLKLWRIIDANNIFCSQKNNDIANKIFSFFYEDQYCGMISSEFNVAADPLKICNKLIIKQQLDSLRDCISKWRVNKHAKFSELNQRKIKKLPKNIIKHYFETAILIGDQKTLEHIIKLCEYNEIFILKNMAYHSASSGQPEILEFLLTRLERIENLVFSPVVIAFLLISVLLYVLNLPPPLLAPALTSTIIMFNYLNIPLNRTEELRQLAHDKQEKRLSLDALEKEIFENQLDKHCVISSSQTYIVKQLSGGKAIIDHGTKKTFHITSTDSVTSTSTPSAMTHDIDTSMAPISDTSLRMRC